MLKKLISYIVHCLFFEFWWLFWRILMHFLLRTCHLCNILNINHNKSFIMVKCWIMDFWWLIVLRDLDRISELERQNLALRVSQFSAQKHCFNCGGPHYRRDCPLQKGANDNKPKNFQRPAAGNKVGARQVHFEDNENLFVRKYKKTLCGKKEPPLQARQGGGMGAKLNNLGKRS